MKIKSFIALTAMTCLTFASTVQAKGLCGCAALLPSSKPRLYVDVGLGHAFDSYFPNAKNIVTFNYRGYKELDSVLSPEDRTLTNNLSLEGGFVWEDPYQVNSPYFPFISLGLHYQYNNFDQKKTLMKVAFIVKEDGNSGERRGQTHYTFLQNNLLANLKMDLYRWGRIMPYVNLGLGASWNQSKQQSPFAITGRDNSGTYNFSNSKLRNTSFSYQVGGGLDFLATNTFWVSLGYVYNNFGKVQIAKLYNKDSGIQFINTLQQAFNFRNVTAHTIQLTGRYVFG